MEYGTHVRGYSAGVYSTLNQQMKKYREERNLQESDERHTKYKMLKQRAEEQGLDTSAQRVASMLERVSKIVEGEQPFGKEGPPEHTEQATPKSTAFNIILNAIKNKTLGQLWDNIKHVPREKLSPVARIIQDDVKHNETLKQELNDKIEKTAKKISGDLMTFSKSEIADKKLDTNLSPLVDEMIQLLEGDKKNESDLNHLLEQAEKVNSNVAKQLSAQRAKFGTPSRASSEASTEQGTEMGNPRLGAPIQYRTAESYINAKKDLIHISGERKKVRAYLRSNFGMSVDEAQKAFPTPPKNK